MKPTGAGEKELEFLAAALVSEAARLPFCFSSDEVAENTER